MTGKVIVIGISGTTNSGKSTLASRLVQDLPGSQWVCQDSYFMPPGDPRLAPLYIPNLDHHNWEDYRALEMDRMVEDLKKLISQAEQASQEGITTLVVEGFSIFGYRTLEMLLDKKYFVTVDRDVCWARRQTRNYNPPDKPGYFDQVVWPSYQTHLKQIQDQQDIVFFNGNNGIEELHKRICDDMDQLTSALDQNS